MWRYDLKDENTEKKSALLPILGMVALILVLMAGVKLAFAGLAWAIPQEQTPPAAQSSQTQTEEKTPGYCPYCGEALFEGFQWGQYCPYCGEQIQP